MEKNEEADWERANITDVEPGKAGEAGDCHHCIACGRAVTYYTRRVFIICIARGSRTGLIE